jgi:hypothetical protein
MIRKGSLVGLTLALGWMILGALWLALNVAAAGADKSFPVRQGNGIITPTHFVYLPLVPNEQDCANPPTGTLLIAGRATVHGRPAQPGVPFSLWYRHWEYQPYPVMTTTTRSGGSFCFGPIEPLDYCYAIWYHVYFDRAVGSMPTDDYIDWWLSDRIYACEAGRVYTVSAEIGKQ